MPRLAEPNRITLDHNSIAHRLAHMCYIYAGVDQYRFHCRVVVCVTVEQEQSRLRSNGNPDLISHLQTPAAFKMLLVKEDLNVALKLPLISFRQATIEWNITLDDFEP